MKRLALVAALLGAACTVPDKFFTDGGSGDDTNDASTGPDAGEDTVAPETTIDSAPVSPDNAASFSISFSANEDATFQCSLDGAAPADCDSPFEASATDGPHTFSVRATDLAGNPDDTPAEHPWLIDTRPPETTITAAPPVNDNSVMVGFAFAADEAATFECAVDPAGFGPCSLTGGHEIFGLTDGTRTFRVRATDSAGNVDATPDVHTWTTDTSTPDTVIDSGPTGSVASTTAVFDYSSPDAGAGATYECSLDGAAFSSCLASGVTYGGLTEVTHTFAVRVRDAGGNYDPSPATQMWTVDVTAPTTTIVTGPSGTVASQTATFTFSSNETGATFQCQLDGGSYAACPATHQITGLAQGGHTLNVRAVDLAGTPDASPAQRMWSVDTVGPVVAFANPTPPQNGTSGPYVTIAWTVSDGTATCQLDGVAYSPCTSPQSMSLREAAHQFQVSAVDGAGNPGSATRDWTVDCTQPALPGGVVQFHMDETGTNQTLTNSISGGVNGTLGASATIETVDPARVATARFAGGLSYLAAENELSRWDVTGNYSSISITMEMWIRPTLSGTAVQELMATGDARFVIYQANFSGQVRIELQVMDDAGVPHYVTAPNIAADVWHHVVATYVAATDIATLYIDGAPVGTTTALAQGFMFDPLTIGTHSAIRGPTALFDEVNVGPSAISATDVLNRWCPQ
jgi:hypothetical protein